MNLPRLRLRLRLALVSAVAAMCVLAGGASSSLALFSDAASAGTSTLATGYWSAFAFYLHNDPTPPTANTTAANRTGSLVAYLRDFNPSSASYVDVGSATYTATYRTGRAFYETPVTVTLAAPYILGAGHRLELRVESPSATSAADMLVADDTRTYVSSLTLS